MLNATVGVRRLLVRLRPGPPRRSIPRVSHARHSAVTAIAGAFPWLLAFSSVVMSRAAKLPRAMRRARPIATRRPTGVRHPSPSTPLAEHHVADRHLAERHPAGAHRIRTQEVLLRRLRRGTAGLRRLSWLAARSALRSPGVRERAIPLGVATLVLVASAVSVTAGSGSSTGIGNTGPAGEAPRLAIAGADGADSATGYDGSSVGARMAALDGPERRTDPEGPFLDDGTLLMPVAVNTTVADGSAKLKPYKVRSGDTLTGIAHRFGVSMMSIWWANSLTSKDKLHIGQVLLIPPVTGLVITVADGDTLDSIAQRTGATPDEIVAYNGLADTNLVIGQKLIIPGAQGAAIPMPKPTPKPVARSSGSSSSTSYRPPPATYGGGPFAWPVPGGTISQYFHYGHPAIDIQAPYGTRVVAAASGTVIYAGWNNNGGGYQVWISHGSGLYTTYNHLSAITVGVGERVGRAEQVGRVGQSGWATGPHCHFEVWRGYPWQGSSYRVNPLIYL